MELSGHKETPCVSGKSHLRKHTTSPSVFFTFTQITVCCPVLTFTYFTVYFLPWVCEYCLYLSHQTPKLPLDCLDIGAARTLLDNDHYAMDKLKRRVLEYLAVRQLKTSLKVCLVRVAVD